MAGTITLYALLAVALNAERSLLHVKPKRIIGEMTMTELHAMTRKQQSEELMALAGDLLLNGDQYGWATFYKAAIYIEKQPESRVVLVEANKEFTDAKATIAERGGPISIDGDSDDGTGT